jgi:L-aspartate oxidase
METFDTDYLVIGSGMAGLVAALQLAEAGDVTLVTKQGLSQSNSDWAQGGVACVMDPEDRVEDHVQDTLTAGAGLCDEAAVRQVLAYAPAAIQVLERYGVRFERRAGSQAYDLGREAGHSARRILHAGDITGHEILKPLIAQVEAHARITVRTRCMAIDLVTTSWLGVAGANRCVGCYFLARDRGEVFAVRAAQTVLATGGAGKVYQYTSNPDVATGDGIAMAWRSGLPIKNMEFMQFHPTCLYHPKAKSFLISEAVRGEGAELVNAAGEAFMAKYDARGALAPRDIVARAIDREIKRRGDRCVYLDITHKPKDFLTTRFPNIYATCLQFGVDMAVDRVPVVPAAHYLCGGVEADVDGATALAGLSVCGETACTGMHGANRLASNSLLEALVSACRMAERVTAEAAERPGDGVAIPTWRSGDAVPSDEAVVIEHNWSEVRTCMANYVGIVRTNKWLERAARRVRNVRREIRQYYLEYVITAELLELRNLAAVAELIIRSAGERRESRGLHYTLDYPEPYADGRIADTRIQDVPGDSVQAL